MHRAHLRTIGLLLISLGLIAFAWLVRAEDRAEVSTDGNGLEERAGE